MDGAAACSSGNQSGGLDRSSICAAVYSLALPGTWIGPLSSPAGGGCLSGVRTAHAGRPLSADGAWACNVNAAAMATNTRCFDMECLLKPPSAPLVHPPYREALLRQRNEIPRPSKGACVRAKTLSRPPPPASPLLRWPAHR